MITNFKIAPEVVDRFLDLLTDGEHVKVASKRIGYSWSYMYRMKKALPEFNERWLAAIQDGNEIRADQLEEIAEKRAIKGDKILLIFMLKSLRPERFSDRHRDFESLKAIMKLKDIPGYQDLCDGLLTALEPYPDALKAVIAVLERTQQEPKTIEGHTLN